MGAPSRRPPCSLAAFGGVGALRIPRWAPQGASFQAARPAAVLPAAALGRYFDTPVPLPGLAWGLLSLLPGSVRMRWGGGRGFFLKDT